jgi:phage-related baseplate assembly protein
MSAPSHDQAYDQGRVVALVARPDLLLSPGDIADLPSRAGAAMADLIIGNAAGRIRATFLDGAEGDDLTILARDHWGLERTEASFAIGQVTFAHSAGPSGTIAAGTRVASVQATDGSFVTITTDSDIVWGASDTSRTVAATATLAGATGNVGIGQVSRILDTLFTTGFSVTNASAFAGGQAEETDTELRERVRGYNQTLRRGTLAALEFGAKVVPQVKKATAVETPASGVVTIYVTDADGNSNAAMVAAVTTEIENWRAAGVLVTITGGSIVDQAVSISLTVRAGSDSAALASKASAAVKALNRRIGETLFRSVIAAAARAVDPENILNVVVNTPSADLVPSANQLIRIPTVTVT